MRLLFLTGFPSPSIVLYKNKTREIFWLSKVEIVIQKGSYFTGFSTLALSTPQKKKKNRAWGTKVQ
jgi:hypothetical protein